MKKGNNLKWIIGVCSLALAVFGLTGCGGGGGGGGGVNTGTNAPASIAGRSITHTITDGTAPFPTSGTFVLHADGAPGDTTGNYTITGSGGVTNSSGSYTYSMTDTNTATLNLSDSSLGNVTESLLFNTTASGTFNSTSDAGGSQSGTFTLQ
jgi:hypothetical protein